MNEVVYRLKVQLNKLDATVKRIERHEKELFEECVAAEAMGDDARASLYANEWAEVRKLLRLLLKGRLALEQIILKLEETPEATVAEALKALRRQLGGILPEVGYELGLIADKLERRGLKK